jgi:hypothetical protein
MPPRLRAPSAGAARHVFGRHRLAPSAMSSGAVSLHHPSRLRAPSACIARHVFGRHRLAPPATSSGAIGSPHPSPLAAPPACPIRHFFRRHWPAPQVGSGGSGKGRPALVRAGGNAPSPVRDGAQGQPISTRASSVTRTSPAATRRSIAISARMNRVPVSRCA